MKKVLIITHDFLPQLGGAQVVAYDYANLLLSLGYDVTVMSKAYPNPIQNTPFHYIQVPNRFGKYLWLLNFGCFFKSFSFDIYDCIFLNQYPDTTVAGKFFDEKTLKKSIPIIQGLDVEGIYKNKKIINNLFHLFLRLKHCHRRAIKFSRKVVSVSEFHKWKVLRAAGMEFYADKFQVIHTGINRTVFHPVFSDFKQKMGWENKELLVTVSRIEKMKGFVEMLEVFAKLVSHNDAYQWLIIGDGLFLKELRQLIAEKGLSDKIYLLGAKKREELKYYYSAADCFWLLSNYDECLPLVYLEAQSCGIPVIGRNKGGVVETINHGKTGFLVNNEAECLDILLNKKYKVINTNDLNTFVGEFDRIEATKALIS